MSSKYFRNTISDKDIILKKKIIQKRAREINNLFPSFKCSTSDKKLVCTGEIQPGKYSTIYNFKIKYNPDYIPKVYIVSPKISYNQKIHMYKSTRLCLYYPKDFKWNNSIKLTETIIPWTSEWLVYYELYKKCGKWLGPEVKHENEQKTIK